MVLPPKSTKMCQLGRLNSTHSAQCNINRYVIILLLSEERRSTYNQL